MSSVSSRRLPYVVAALLLVLSACGGDSTSPPPPPPPPPPAIASVVIEADAKNVPIGGTLQLRTVVKDVTGATRTDAVTWTAVDADVATVSTGGLVSGVKGGVARVRATVAAISDEASVSVARVYAPGTPIEVIADPSGVAHVYTPSFGGLHFRLTVGNEAGGTVPGAVIGYSEQDGKAAFAIDGPDATWAPGLLWGTPDSLLVRAATGAPYASSAASLAVTVAALQFKLGKLTELGIPGHTHAYQLAKMFANLGADNGACMSLTDAAPILKTRPNREAAFAFRAHGLATSSLVSASVLKREALAESNASVAEELRSIGVAKWGLPPGTTVSTRVRMRNDFLDGLKLGQAFKRFWDMAVLVTDDPACAAAIAALAFDVQPSATLTNTAIAPAVKVSLRDAGGTTIATATDQVTIAQGQNNTGAALSGTLTRAAVSGVATFNDLKIDKPGTYTLTASASGKNANSVTFTVTAPAQGTLGVGSSHACGITAAGPTWCWGGGSPGTNGDGGANHSAFAPSEVVGSHLFTMMGGGSLHSCAIDVQGKAWCWGMASGMLGNGSGGVSATPVLVSGNHTFKWITGGGVHQCGVRTDGAAYCWGSNNSSQIGDNDPATSRLVPSLVAGGHTFASIVGGGVHTCALTPQGEAWCWGANMSGQLGDGTTTTRPVPTKVAGNLVFTQLSANGQFTCGLVASGQAYCWGLNSEGQLGDNSNLDRLVPTPVSGVFAFSRIAAGGNHSCGLVAGTGAAYCWGGNLSGQLGIGSTSTRSLTPVAVAGNHVWRDLVAGALFTCGIDASDKKAYCWGANNFGQLGNATNTNASLPGPIFGSLVF